MIDSHFLQPTQTILPGPRPAVSRRAPRVLGTAGIQHDPPRSGSENQPGRRAPCSPGVSTRPSTQGSHRLKARWVRPPTLSRHLKGRLFESPARTARETGTRSIKHTSSVLRTGPRFERETNQHKTEGSSASVRKKENVFVCPFLSPLRSFPSSIGFHHIRAPVETLKRLNCSDPES